MSGHLIGRDELDAPARHFFLSPHYDDIALSCGGTVALLAQAGREATVALIFGDHPDPAVPLTPFARQLHEQWGMDAAEVIAGRRREESAAGAILGTSDRFLPFRDAIYRGERYLNDDELFGVTAPDEASFPAAIIAAAGLGGIPDGATRVYAPLAIGRHVDHQHAGAAGVWLARAGWEVWFYEDLPYALNPGSREDRLATDGDHFAVAALVDVSATWAAKIAAILAYPSQLAVVFGYVGSGSSRAEIDAVMAAYAEQAGDGVRAERYWRLAGDRERS